jgi:hypothetical protein
MTAAKEEVEDLLGRFPESASWHEVQRHVRRMVQHELDAGRCGAVSAHEEGERRGSVDRRPA